MVSTRAATFLRRSEEVGRAGQPPGDQRVGAAPRAAAGAPDVVAGLELLSHVTSPWTFRLLVLLTAGVLWQYGRRRLATWAVLTMAVDRMHR